VNILKLIRIFLSLPNDARVFQEIPQRSVVKSSLVTQLFAEVHGGHAVLFHRVKYNVDQ